MIQGNPSRYPRAQVLLSVQKRVALPLSSVPPEQAQDAGNAIAKGAQDAGAGIADGVQQFGKGIASGLKQLPEIKLPKFGRGKK